MRKGERILFIVALIVSVAAVLLAAFAAYFGIYYTVMKFSDTGDGIAMAFSAVFFVLLALISWCISLVTLPLFALAPLRSESRSVRRTSLVALCVLGALFLLNVCLFIVVV